MALQGGRKLTVFLVAGARPNFMKIAPLYRSALKYHQLDCRIVHTGQHYDYEMSGAFFADLELPEPDSFLNAGSGSHAVQTARIMVAFDRLCHKERPDLVVVVGDVNSTLACSLVAKKLLIKVAHIEAGLRSFDLTMPEEINRIVTDSISDYLFVTEESGIANLVHEGKLKDKIYFVGNVMIDNLFYNIGKLQNNDGTLFSSHKIKPKGNEYIFLTLHRPSNVDNKKILEEITDAMNQIAKEKEILFSMHPRTKRMLDQFDILLSSNIRLLPPLSFKEALFLWKDAEIVMTDSGGLQEETTALGVPCITLRENTERPITVELGTNLIGGNQKKSILNAYKAARTNKKKKNLSIPPKWDGRTSERIWTILLKEFRLERKVI